MGGRPRGSDWPEGAGGKDLLGDALHLESEVPVVVIGNFDGMGVVAVAKLDLRVGEFLKDGCGVLPLQVSEDRGEGFVGNGSAGIDGALIVGDGDFHRKRELDFFVAVSGNTRRIPHPLMPSKYFLLFFFAV
jgi:hypothetical protein